MLFTVDSDVLETIDFEMNRGDRKVSGSKSSIPSTAYTVRD